MFVVQQGLPLAKGLSPTAKPHFWRECFLAVLPQLEKAQSRKDIARAKINSDNLATQP